MEDCSHFVWVVPCHANCPHLQHTIPACMPCMQVSVCACAGTPLSVEHSMCLDQPPCVCMHDACRLVIEKDRLYVYCQALPREPPPLPAAKVLVSPLPYTIERLANTQADLALGS